MPRVNVNVLSQDELYFTDIDGAILRADTYDNLVARIVAYRERNGKAKGRPVEELQLQLSKRNPGIVRPGATKSALKHGVSFKGRVLHWLDDIRKRKDSLVFVRDSDRNARVNICAACPFNQSASAGCGTCKAALAEQRHEIIGRRAVDSRMGGCEKLSEDLSTSTWIDEPTVENSDLPAHCWRRRSV